MDVFSRIVPASALIFGAMYVNVGVQHFTNTAWFQPIVPAVLGDPTIWVLITGTMKLVILRNLHRVTEEQAHDLIELGWKSRWRFVINNTHRIVEKHFPNYPHKEAMLEHGFRSVEYWPQHRP